MRVRKSAQLDAINKVITNSKHPVSAEQLLEEAQSSVPSLGIATVYRTLKLLIEDGKLVAHEIPGHATVYEQTGLKHHHHFVCGSCDRVYDVAGCAGDLRRLVPKNFILEDHEIILRGRCNECR